MRIEKSRGILGSGRGTGFVAMGALVACSWIVGCGGESGDDGDDDGGTAGTSAGKGGTSGGKGGSAGSTSGAGGTGNAGSGGAAGTTGGAGGSAGTTGGGAGDDGNAGEGASGGTSGDAGEGNVGGETGDAGEGGTTGDAGEGNAGGVAGALGEGGTGGATPDDPTVRGRLIDFYGHPVPGVTIGIGETEVVTNAQGEFVIEDVPEVYDVSFVVTWSSLRTEIYGWVFQGLTRRDPTLQVFQGLNERSMNTNLRVQDGAPTATQRVQLAIGSQHGSWQHNIPANGRDSATYYWMGPATTAATAHGLMWSYDEDTDLPTDYVSYTTFPFALDDAAATQTINVSVAATDFAQGNIGGTVTDISESARANYGFVRFTSGTTLDLFEDTEGPGTFSYLVPQLPDGSITFAALDEEWQTLELALVHQDGVAPGTTNMALTIPATPSLTTPAPNTTIDDTTAFTYQNRQDGVGAVVVRIEDDDYYQGIFIVTSSTNFTIPEVLQGGFTLREAGVHFWQVQAHGTYASVDAMASSTGYADAFAMDWYRPQGPKTGSGTLAMSARRYFTYEPQ